MKKTKLICWILAASILVSSCTSAFQASSGATGAMIGSNVGSAVGILSGHGRFRGENAALGSLIGMGIGAMLGVGIANQIEQNERNEAARSNPPAQREDDGYYGNRDYQTSGGAYAGTTSSAVVSISELTYMDADGDGYITKDETIEVEGFITNTSDHPLRDIVIHLSVNTPKNFTISPSLTTTLQPGQRIRYTGRVHCNKRHGIDLVNVQLNATHTGKTSTSNGLRIRVK